MTTMTVDQLEGRVREVIVALARGGDAVEVTLDGEVVATLAPAGGAAGERPNDAGPPMSPEEIDAFWAPWREVWDAVGDRWPESVSAVDAVREQRRG